MKIYLYLNVRKEGISKEREFAVACFLGEKGRYRRSDASGMRFGGVMDKQTWSVVTCITDKYTARQTAESIVYK